MSRIRFNLDAWENGLLVNGINQHSKEAKLIRAGVHSLFNHNAQTATKNGIKGIAEAVPPKSRLTTLAEYEHIMNHDDYIIRLYRLKSFTAEQRENAAQYFVDCLLGIPYPKKWKMILLSMPVYNAFVDRTGWLPPLRLSWCSQLVKKAYESVDQRCLVRYDGKVKVLFTPRTFEKRASEGLFEDVTEEKLIVCS